MSGPAHSCTATMPAAAAASQRGGAGFGALVGRQQVPGGGAHQVVGVGGQRPLRVEAGRGRQVRRQPPQAPWTRARSARRRGPGRRAGHRPRRRGRRCSARAVSGQDDSSQPCPQTGSSGWARGVVGEQSAGSARASVAARRSSPAERQAGGGDMDVAVDERRRDETAVEIDDLGVGKHAAADVVAAQPRHDAVADGHRGRVGLGRAVHPAVDQQGYRCGANSHCRSQAKTTCTVRMAITVDQMVAAPRQRPSNRCGRAERLDVADVDDLAVDVVAVAAARAESAPPAYDGG